MTGRSAPSDLGATRSGVPWALADARWLFFGTVTAAGLLGAAWWQASGTGRAGGQTGWVVAGVVAVVLSGAANAWWLLSARQAVARRAAELAARVEVVLPAGARRGEVLRLLWIPGTARYHRDGCILVTGKAGASEAARGAHEKAGRRPCEVCRP